MSKRPAKLLVIGAGDHALVVVDAILTEADDSRRIPVVNIVLDKSAGGDSVDEATVLHAGPQPDHRVVNGIGFTGGINHRHNAFQRFRRYGFAIAGVRHARSIVSPTATIAASSQILGGASVGPFARLDEDCIVNTGAIVEHHAMVGSGAHVGPGATLCGRVSVGSGAFIGAGSTVIPGVHIGSEATVAAGATVVGDVPDGALVGGTPARPLR